MLTVRALLRCAEDESAHGITSEREGLADMSCVESGRKSLMRDDAAGEPKNDVDSCIPKSGSHERSEDEET